MNLNKFTEKAQEAVLAAPQLASELNHAQVEPEHLLVTLLEQPEGVVPAVLQKLNADPVAVARALREHLGRQPKAYGGAEPGLSPRLRVVLDAAQAEAKTMQDEYVSTEHLLLGSAVRAGPCGHGRNSQVARRHAREGARGADGHSRQPARHRSEPREQVPGARALRPRSHRARPPRQARSGDRPRRRSAPRHPGALAPHEEQPGPHRRARRRQDGHRRRPGAADRPRRRARRV